jgi:hypothetical protein
MECWRECMHLNGRKKEDGEKAQWIFHEVQVSQNSFKDIKVMKIGWAGHL